MAGSVNENMLNSVSNLLAQYSDLIYAKVTDSLLEVRSTSYCFTPRGEWELSCIPVKLLVNCGRADMEFALVCLGKIIEKTTWESGTEFPGSVIELLRKVSAYGHRHIFCPGIYPEEIAGWNKSGVLTDHVDFYDHKRHVNCEYFFPRKRGSQHTGFVFKCVACSLHLNQVKSVSKKRNTDEQDHIRAESTTKISILSPENQMKRFHNISQKVHVLKQKNIQLEKRLISLTRKQSEQKHKSRSSTSKTSCSGTSSSMLCEDK